MTTLNDLTASSLSATPSLKNIDSRLDIGTLLLIGLAWLGTYFPWVAARPTAFSVNLYDLAEWSSLNPIVRGGPYPLLATFCLRVVVGLLAMRLSVQAAASPQRAVRWLIRGLALLIGIGLLPPLDFFRGAVDDPNYRQQFIIALLTCLVLLATWRLRQALGRERTAWSGLVLILLNWFALALSMAGLVLGLQALGLIGLHVGYGLGAALTILALGVLVISRL